jgi:hypothetical protein
MALAAAATADDFEIQAGWNDQLFPSFIVATATIKLPQEAVEEYEGTELGDPQGLLGITIEAPEDDTEITVTVTCDEIMEESEFTGTLATGGETYTILPKIKWNYKALMKQRQAVPITVTFTVEVGDEDEVEQSRTLTLRSVNDCPFTVVENGEARDVSFMFAAYVNEQHPFVDKLLREALTLEDRRFVHRLSIEGPGRSLSAGLCDLARLEPARFAVQRHHDDGCRVGPCEQPARAAVG